MQRRSSSALSLAVLAIVAWPMLAPGQELPPGTIVFANGVDGVKALPPGGGAGDEYELAPALGSAIDLAVEVQGGTRLYRIVFDPTGSGGGSLALTDLDAGTTDTVGITSSFLPVLTGIAAGADVASIAVFDPMLDQSEVRRFAPDLTPLPTSAPIAGELNSIDSGDCEKEFLLGGLGDTSALLLAASQDDLLVENGPVPIQLDGFTDLVAAALGPPPAEGTCEAQIIGNTDAGMRAGFIHYDPATGAVLSSETALIQPEGAFRIPLNNAAVGAGSTIYFFQSGGAGGITLVERGAPSRDIVDTAAGSFSYIQEGDVVAGGEVGGPECGNGEVEAGEACEEGVPLAETCASLGFGGGALACVDCALDTSGCAPFDAVFLVTVLEDGPDSQVGDGVCSSDLAGGCSLRAAVQEANAAGAPVLILLPGGTFLLTVVGAGEDASASGDLDLSGDIVLAGAGPGLTRIDANGSDRVLDVQPGAEVLIEGVTLAGGLTSGAGGCLRNQGEARLVDVAFEDCDADFGGCLSNSGTLVCERCEAALCEAIEGGGFLHGGDSNLVLVQTTVTDSSASQRGGAGVCAGPCSLLDSVFSGNQGADGAGLFCDGALQAESSTVSGNQGGGIFAAPGCELDGRNVTISGNQFEGLLLDPGANGSCNNCTIARNGTDVVNDGDLDLTNSIVGDCLGSLDLGGGNFLENGDGCSVTATPEDQVGTAAEPLDAGLGPLGDNGGSVPTHAVPEDSPAAATGGSGGTSCEPRGANGVAPASGCTPGAYQLPTSTCNNGIDDDGDALIDFPQDRGCADVVDDSELDPSAPCDDGEDNDLDGRTDGDDPGCTDPADPSELGDNECDNGLDDDGDEEIDVNDGGCSGPGDPSESVVGESEACGSCGVGGEVILLLTPLWLLARRRARKRGATSG